MGNLPPKHNGRKVGLGHGFEFSQFDKRPSSSSFIVTGDKVVSLDGSTRVQNISRRSTTR